jgi:hypothetical protein
MGHQIKRQIPGNGLPRNDPPDRRRYSSVADNFPERDFVGVTRPCAPRGALSRIDGPPLRVLAFLSGFAGERRRKAQSPKQASKSHTPLYTRSRLYVDLVVVSLLKILACLRAFHGVSQHNRDVGWHAMFWVDLTDAGHFRRALRQCDGHIHRMSGGALIAKDMEHISDHDFPPVFLRENQIPNAQRLRNTQLRCCRIIRKSLLCTSQDACIRIFVWRPT